MIARDLATLIPCAYCGAGDEQSCRTSSGARAAGPHAARFDPMYEAWREGFEEGQRDILGALDNAEQGEQWGARYIESARKRLGGAS